jgi:ribosomal protein S18 acetylase RimI-like enzyme
MPARLHIRRATRRDAPALIAFNSAMALETERKALLPGVIGAGVRGLLRRPDSGFYIVAEIAGEVVAALMVTKEWSDWRNGDFWWIQSVYVQPEYRRRGIYTRLYRHLKALAARERALCGFRLYVERHNRRAQATYRACGMERTHYLVFEELRPGLRFFTPTTTSRRSKSTSSSSRSRRGFSAGPKS